uniref:glycosyltransferase family 2 protein n=1 Tax=Azorhizobium sp. AG788 TaxID=2183897 RepID=UPI003139DFAD
MPEQIPPRWLRITRNAAGQPSATLPTSVRLKVRGKGLVFVLVLRGVDAPIDMVFRDGAGRDLSRARMQDGEDAVFIPRGAAAVTVFTTAPAVRLGYFPRSKLGLKLHAFLSGRFGSSGIAKRWRTAGAAARNLRGLHGALLQSSPAHRQEQADHYRRYRARYGEDAGAPVAPGADLSISFVTVLPASGMDLAACRDALLAQSDPGWEWLVVQPDTVASDAVGADQRVRRLHPPSSDPADSFNSALEAATGTLLVPLDPCARPTRHAVAMLRAAFAAHPDGQMLYTDEERLDAAGHPMEGIFKPAFNPHLLRSVDYIGQSCVFRATLLRAIAGARPGFGGAVLYDLRLRAVETLPASAIYHLPRVAFSRTPDHHGDTFGPRDIDAAARAVRDATGVTQVLHTEGRLRPVYTPADPRPLVSFVIPTRDRADLLGLALRSLIALTRYREFEIIIVDNGSTEPETFALFDEVKALWPATQVVRDDGGFNYPRICNRGVDVASGALICLLNNDIEVVEPGWLDEMVALACLPGTGIVGAKLLFPDRTLQHAGVIAGLFAYAGHWFAHAAATAGGYEDRLHSRQNLSAVTGACLLISRTCWDRIGPLDAERFAEDCNDIDLCLRAMAAGYEVVWSPFACLVHHESASRGRRRAKAHRERLKAQRARFEARWHASTLVDPHYNPNLRRKSLYATLASAPEGSRAPRTASV